MASPLKLTVRSRTDCRQISLQSTDTIETVLIVILCFITVFGLKYLAFCRQLSQNIDVDCTLFRLFNTLLIMDMIPYYSLNLIYYIVKLGAEIYYGY